jgi:RNA polymerase sigma-70 factor, ECF subfamily
VRIRFLGLEEILALHADQIARYGGAAGVRDLGVLESAVAAPDASALATSASGRAASPVTSMQRSRCTLGACERMRLFTSTVAFVSPRDEDPGTGLGCRCPAAMAPACATSSPMRDGARMSGTLKGSAAEAVLGCALRQVGVLLVPEPIVVAVLLVSRVLGRHELGRGDVCHLLDARLRSMSALRDLAHSVANGLAPADRLAAERALCVQLAPRIRLYALRHLRNEAAAVDVVQDALLILLEAARAGRIEDPDHVDRFVLGTCRNLVSRMRRNERRARTFAVATLPLQSAELPPAFSQIDAARLALCLGRVNSRAQRVVLLTFQEDRSVEEIATELGISPGNVRVLRHRAIAALHRCVEGSTP